MSDTTQISLAVEDKFVIFNIGETKTSLPTDELTLSGFSKTLSEIMDTYDFVFDIRNLPQMFNDVIDFISAISYYCKPRSITGIVRNVDEFNILQSLKYTADLKNLRIHGVFKEHDQFNYKKIDLSQFTLKNLFETYFEPPYVSMKNLELYREYLSVYVSEYLVTNFEEMCNYLNTSDAKRLSILHAFLEINGRNSVLNEFAFTINNEYITVVPYHSHAFFNINSPNNRQTIIARPGVIARQTGSILSQELKEFEAIINKIKPKENDIQKFLEQHRHFFHGLNYKNVYPQLVLDRPTKGNFIPDFICEPIGSEWCDILDLKIPITEPIDVGVADRARLAAFIADGVAQLREYAAWFEDEQNFKSFRKKYGLSVYKPRLKLIVGRDPRNHDEKQLRRMMTAYDDIDILTYDQFLRICNSRLLI